MALTSGTRLGPYEILSALGAGGMGEVYRARDARLSRDVALKVLPGRLAADEDRVARFAREARLLASLNHPNIGSIYGLEEAGGVTALVLELIEGETLHDRMRRERLTVAEALALARQIADALDAAHSSGIIHRDLKPSNIKIRPDGMVKVLDFGIARALEAGGSQSENSSTITLGGTNPGAIIGTAAYMSPEQARGQAVDRRSDVWAFGCVLFEMLTGSPVFARETVTDTIAAVVTDEPKWTSLPANTPAGVRRVLKRCLQKDVRQRIRDIADVRIDIEDAIDEPPARIRSAARAAGS
jgi:serine/threonine protein kinase